MAVTLPLFMNGVSYSAEAERQGFAGLVAQASAGVARTGILGPAPAVTLSGATVKVGAFKGAIGSTKGVYLVAAEGVTDATGTVAAADQTNARLDRVVLEVLDPDNGITGGTKVGRLRVITGTAAAIPTLPALPALAMHVATVQVPRANNGSPAVLVDGAFTAAAGAPVPVRSEADRGTLLAYDGAQALRLDLPGRPVDVHNGTKWIPGGTPKQTITLQSLYTTDPPRGDGLAQEPPSCYRAGRRVHLSGVASNTEAILFVGGAEYTLGNLPAGFLPAFPEYFALEVAFTPCRLWVRPDGQIRFMLPNTVGQLSGRVAKFALSGISFDAA